MRSLLAYSTSTTLEEKLTLRIRADNSGDIYIPTAGYSPDGTQDCEYDWMVGIDDNTAVEYSGIGSSTGKIRVGFGLTPLSTHTVIIKPKEEEYGWLRAFGYKGTSIANSLTNIINDKSYKGYALSEIYTGNYFKAYQYYGCTNLINTDEELLPNTLEIIGDNYRAYEYSGCVKLVSNADERILKTVKVIGDNYRAYQYQNCTGINRIYMRAINWASVGTGYRDNQYSGTAADKSPMNIYIEGGIEEGGSWGLLNDRVKNIYVYDGLVSDYQTKLDTITSSKIKKNAEWDNFEYEFIEFDAIADSNGEIRIPVGGYSTTGTQDCEYDWYVSIDGGEPEEISGTGGATYVSVGEDLEEGSEHRIIIKPDTVSYGWGRAFGFYNTGAQDYIKEIIHDSYKCYASNRVETGDYYKYGVFSGCTNLINSYEKLPTSVTTIGNYYMKECYSGCTGLKTAFWEVMHKGCSIGSDYRYNEYNGCTGMEVHKGIAGGDFTTVPSGYRSGYLVGAGNDLDVYITRKLGMRTVSTYFPSSSKYTVTINGRYIAAGTFQSTSNQGITYGYFTKDHNGTEYNFDSVASSEYETIGMYGTIDAENGDLIYNYTYTPSYGGGKIINTTLKLFEPLGLNENNVNKIYAYVDDLYDLKNGLGFNYEKIGAYYYGYVCYEFKDIDKYTKLVASKNIGENIAYDGGGYKLMRGLAVNRKRNFSKFSISAVIGGEYNQGGSGSGPQALIVGYNLSKGGDLSTIPTTYSVIDATQQSSWSGTNYTFVGGQRYARNGSLIYHYTNNGSNRDYYGDILGGNALTSIPGGSTGSIYTATGISDNGLFAWGGLGMYKLATKNTASGNTIIGGGFGSVGLTFSNDGLKAYVGYGIIKEYSLNSPWNTSGATDTGRTLNIGTEGSFDISVDGKYLFVYRDGTIYQYTYE